jgi:cardiolipin synthase
MSSSTVSDADDRQTRHLIRELADRALSRAAGARLLGNTHVRLLKDAAENYPAWLNAINSAKHHIHFESYFICEDEAGQQFADALTAKAREGLQVRLIYDWMGNFRKASRRFWNRIGAGGVEVRCYNPPRLSTPLGWLSRDHRKTLVIDGRVGFISGLCVGGKWIGDPTNAVAPWRDTGVEVQGLAVFEIEQAFAQVWALIGEPIPALELTQRSAASSAGNMHARIVASLPATAGMIRLDELVAALARDRLWLADAYFAGTTSYLQALSAAAKDGVDVRLLVPNTTDIPVLRPLSRVGYRPLLEAGVRVFEWNGAMMHAKTAVTDGRWGRVGSTNLNVASWFGNCELDVVVEDDSFAREMEAMYLQDLADATEIVLDLKKKIHRLSASRLRRPVSASGTGSAGQAAAGAIRIGHVIGASLTNRRELEPVEARIMLAVALLLSAFAALFALFPLLFVYPVVIFCAWLAVALFHRACQLRCKSKREPPRSIKQ